MIIYDGEVAFDGSEQELRTCTDPRVEHFLAPFKDSFKGLFERFMREKE